MKHIPLIFPLAFVAIIAVTFLAGVSAIAEGAVNGRTSVPVVADPTSGDLDGPEDRSASGYEWHENAAIWICPLH